jgi:DeoR/GlpR family transcriptional regulator of sugar metabolism
MSISERQKKILEILNDRHFITVKELATITYTSASSVRRDLTIMQNSGIVKRLHGGVTLPDTTNGVASFHDRMQKNINEKRIIAKKASALLTDGQSIILDGSSSAYFTLPYIAKLNSATVFTNNITTALKSIELGIDTHCLGGSSINGSPVLSGTETYKSLADISADILFFSSQGVDDNGIISDSTEEENYVTSLMLKAAKKKVFLCDSTKFGKSYLYKLTDTDSIDECIFN